MKVVALNGSPRKEGNTAAAIKVVLDVLEKEGIETELDRYKTRALDRMADILINGRKSKVLDKDPNGRRALNDLNAT